MVMMIKGKSGLTQHIKSDTTIQCGIKTTRLQMAHDVINCNRLCAGLTLIEILIAIIILTIGVISILSIFPPSIKSASSSIDDTVAAKIAESVSDALNIAMRSATPEDVVGKKPSKAIIVHDGLKDDLNNKDGSYEFALPLPVDPPPGPDKPRFFAHKANGNSQIDVSNSRPKPSDAFWLGNTEVMKKIIDDVVKGPDPSDSYNQYGFTFTIKRMDDDRPTGEAPNPLFQFAIAVYRNQNKEYKEDSKPIHVFIVMIGGK